MASSRSARMRFIPVRAAASVQRRARTPTSQHELACPGLIAEARSLARTESGEAFGGCGRGVLLCCKACVHRIQHGVRRRLRGAARATQISPRSSRESLSVLSPSPYLVLLGKREEPIAAVRPCPHERAGALHQGLGGRTGRVVVVDEHGIDGVRHQRGHVVDGAVDVVGMPGVLVVHQGWQA